MAATALHKNRKIRQDTLREWLSEKCTAQHLIENIDKIEKLDPCGANFVNDLNRLRVANEQRLKVMGKYLPDLKQADIDITADITATEKTRQELEARLLQNGIDPTHL